MLELEQLEYRRMLIVSTAFHMVVFGIVLGMTSFSSHRFLDFTPPGPINVMWARTLRAPEATAPNKLPGPVVSLPQEASESQPQPKHVMPEDLQKAVAEISRGEAARRKAMAEAIAAVRRNVDDRPVPRADNFPSKGGENGLPAGPGGMAGILGGDPIFSGYKEQVRRIITGNFVWIQKRANLRAVVIFNIDEQGNILSPLISKSSGDTTYDAAALRAVRKSSPLPPPPAEIAQAFIKEGLGVNFEPTTK